MKITYLCLRIFGTGGGLEKFNCSFIKALSELSTEHEIQFRAISAYDLFQDVDPRYCDPNLFDCMEGNRFLFTVRAVRESLRADVLIVAHVNIAPVALLCKAINPRLKMITIAYGIDVWGSMTLAKRGLLRLSDRIYAISHYTRDRMARFTGISADKVEILPVTIDPYLIQHEPDSNFRERLGISKNEKVLLTVARLSASERYKGYDRVIRSLPLVRERFPNLKYIIVGKGEREEIARISRVISEVGVEELVELKGFVSEENLVNYYNTTDLFIMPSTGEGFGIVFLEALLHGKPVIAGNRDGSVEALAGGKLGILIEPRDVHAIALAVNDVLARNIPPQLLDADYLKNEVYRLFGYPTFKRRLADLLSRYL
ncbi:MAG: glycosyltransferase family 4 protein [Deltaproteobacteria bacterium]|nr:glycosyltransferase family 4 protein [Deltaproteobacteria bacterium]